MLIAITPFDQLRHVETPLALLLQGDNCNERRLCRNDWDFATVRCTLGSLVVDADKSLNKNGGSAADRTCDNVDCHRDRH